MLNERPPSLEDTNAIPSVLVFWPLVPLRWPNHEMYTWPCGPIAMFGPWLLQTEPLIFMPLLKVAPWSVERAKSISLHPLPWKSDHAAYTLPENAELVWSTPMPVLSVP